MPKRKQTWSEGRQQPGRHSSKKAKQQTAPPRHEISEPNSDESHRTEQLLHRGSVTPPRRQPVRTRRTKQIRTSRQVVRNTLQPSETCCSTLSNSEEESDILHYNPDTALYYPGTDLVIDGWFQPCRGCGAFTAGRLLADLKEAPVCQRCQDKLSKAVEGVIPPETDAGTDASLIDFFYGWMKIKVPLQRQQTFEDRLHVKHDLVGRMYEHWVSCREDARAQNCRIPCA